MAELLFQTPVRLDAATFSLASWQSALRCACNRGRAAIVDISLQLDREPDEKRRSELILDRLAIQQSLKAMGAACEGN